MVNLIDGKKCAELVYNDTQERIKNFSASHNLVPKLVVVIVGNDAASQTYVASKKKKALTLGMQSEIIELDESIKLEKLLKTIDELNRDESVNGILVQLPLPPHLDEQETIKTISPKKDVDGLTPENAGRLALGLEGLYPCTPLGCVILAKTIEPDLTGLNALIIGRSVLVGRPLAALLLQENCTVMVAHSKTKDLPELCKRADLLIAAAGQKHLVRENWVSEKSIVIDVGIHREIKNGKNKLTGDVCFDEVADIVRAITPVPGGVGPMTVACLMRNTINAAIIQNQ